MRLISNYAGDIGPAIDAYKGDPIDGPVMVFLRFGLGPPPDEGGEYPVTTADVSKMADKVVMLLSGRILRDTAQIIDLNVSKSYGRRKLTEISVQAFKP